MYHLPKYLARLLKTFSKSQYTVKDTIDFTKKITKVMKRQKVVTDMSNRKIRELLYL